jgi:hypothetical protein
MEPVTVYVAISILFLIWAWTTCYDKFELNNEAQTKK